MNVVDFLTELRKSEIQISLVDGKLKVKAPTGALTTDIKLRLKDLKEDIISFLKDSQAPNDADIIKKADRSQLLPLSYSQENVWFIDQLAPGSPAYNMPFAFKLTGELSLPALTNALNTIIERHESLRTAFKQTDQGIPYQQVEASEFQIERVELSLASREEFESAAKKCFDEQAVKSFDLEKGNLIRVVLVELTYPDQIDSEYLLIGCMHHIVSDGWSLNIFIRELAVLYASGVSGNIVQLPELPIQYADFAAWQRERLQGDVLKRQSDYWVNQLKDLPGLLALPTDRARTEVQTSNGSVYEFRCPESLFTQVLEFSRRNEVTPFMVFMAAWQVVLSKWAQQALFSVGIPMHGRGKKELESPIGFFVNPLLIRADLSENPTAQELLEAVKNTVLGAFSHQDTPIQLILDQLDVERSLSYQPLAQVGFQLQNFSSVAGVSEDESALLHQFAERTKLKMERLSSSDVSSKFDLILSLSQHASYFDGYVEYNKDLFDESTIAQLVTHLERSVVWVLESVDTSVSGFCLLADAELRQHLNASSTDLILPLTEAQQFIFLDSQVNPTSTQNSTGYDVPLQGEFDPELMRRALQHVTDTYSTMRVKLRQCDLPYADDVYQVIPQSLAVNFEYVDLTEFTDAEARFQQDHTLWIYSAYDTMADDLWAMRLYRTGERMYHLVIKAHHLVVDGIGGVNHALKVAETYKALINSEELPDYVDSFPEYISWNKSNINRSAVVNYWNDKLQSVEPLDFSRPYDVDRELTGFQIARESIDEATSVAIKKYSRKARVHPVDFFRLIYACLLKTYCRAESDFVIYEIHGGRMKGHFDALGVYYQQVPFLIDNDLFKDEVSVAQFFDYEKKTKIEYKDKRSIGIQAQRELMPGGRLGFQYNYFNFIQDIDFGAAAGSMVFHSARVTNAVQLFVKEKQGEFGLELWYDTNNFTSVDLLGRVKQIAHQLVIDDVSCVRELAIANHNELQQLNEWNRNAVALPSFKTIVDWFEAQVSRTPDSVAVIYDDGKLTYTELNQRANQLARWLIESGVGSNDKVAICIGRSLEMLVAVWGVLKSGAAYVPIEANYPKERIAYILEDCAAPLLITESCLQDKLPLFSGRVFCLDLKNQDLESYEPINPSLDIDANDLIYVIYTSGSTGKPKGAGVRHSGELNLLNWYTREFSMSATDKSLLVSAFGFDLTQKNLFAVLLKGGVLVVPPMEHYDDQVVLQSIHKHQITLVNCAPSAFYPLAKTASDNADALSSLRFLFLGGEPIRLENLSEWLALPQTQCKLVNSYGPTECTDVVSYYILNHDVPQNHSIPIGFPVDNTQLFILNDFEQRTPVGIIGELCVAGAGVGVGYLNKSDLTDEVFVQNPFGKGLLYKTGDLARYKVDGSIEYIGRKDFQVKLRGLRIELGEVEFALRQLENVVDSLVLVKADNLIAYVVGGEQTIAGDWRQLLSDYLPEYMIPGNLIILDEWPLTPNGKIDRNALPEPGILGPKTEYVAPRTPTERTLVAIWQEVLKADKVGVRDNFFELGGHSLLATQIASRARKSFNVQIQLRDMLGEPTIEATAPLIDKLIRGGSFDNAICSIDRADRIPLSFAQQRLWLLDRIEPGSVAYNVPLVMRIKGNLNFERLCVAYKLVVQKHEALRACFPEDDIGPYQSFIGAEQFGIEKESVASSFETDIEARRLVAIELMTPFQLETGPLVRCKLIQLNPADAIFVFVAHHIVTDGWSMTLIAKDLATAFASGQLEVNENTLHYADFSAWQRESLAEEALEAHLVYWEDSLASVEPLDFPSDYARPQTQTYNGQTVSFSLDANVRGQFERLAREKSTTLFNVLLSAYASVLHRYTNQNSFAIGTPVAGRELVELESIVGFFVNTLAVPVDFESAATFNEVLVQVSHSFMEGQAHQQIPFEQIVERVNPTRDMSRSPIFQTMLVFQNIPLGEQADDKFLMQLDGLAFEPIALENQTTKFELTLTIAENPDRDKGFECQLQFNTDLFREDTILQFVTHFRSLCESVAKFPDLMLSEHKILTDREIEQQVKEWNSTAVDYDRAASVHSLISHSAKNTPDAIAIRFGDKELSYQELEQSADRIANELIRLGAKPGERIGLCFDRHLHLLSSIIGILKAGGTYVPLDATYPIERLRYIMADANISKVVSYTSYVEIIQDKDIDVINAEEVLQRSNTTQNFSGVQPDPERPLYLIYTSGSTGKPKGTVVQHRSEVNLLNWYTQEFGMSSHDRVLLISAIGFDLTQKNLFAPLLAGATLIVPTFQEYDVDALLVLMRQERVTWINCAPSAFYPLQDHSDCWDALSALRYVFLGGEPINLKRLSAWVSTTACRLVNSYGPTECTDIASSYVVDVDRDLKLPFLPIGRPSYNVKLYVLGRKAELLPIGAIGELYIGGEGVGLGYLNNDVLTDASFLPNPYELKGGRIYRTGDRVRFLRDGNVQYLGRKDHQIKLRGFRIETGEIESIINDSEDVADSLISVWSSGAMELLVAWIVSGVAKSEHGNLVERVSDACKKVLPTHMVPSEWIVLDKFPLTPNGKVDRKALPVPATDLDRVFVEPDSDLEKLVASVWQTVLGHERIGLTDDFFQLGGHSLLATQVVSRVAKQCKTDVNVRMLFENPVLSDFVQKLENSVLSGGAQKPRLIKHGKHEDIPLSHGQQRIWFFEKMYPLSTANNMPGAIRIRGGFNVVAFEQAFREIVRRHESLRTVFYETVDGKPKQRVQKNAGVTLQHVELAGDGNVQGKILELAEADRVLKFDLMNGPLIRATIATVGAPSSVGEYVLFFCMHHIVSDGLSITNLLKEMAVLYVAFSNQQPSPLPELLIQYPDFAIWQREFMDGPALASQIDYWKNKLEGAPPLLTMPTDFPRPKVQTTHGTSLPLAFSEGFNQKLTEFCHQYNVTPFVFMLMTWKILLAKYSNQKDIVVGVPLGGRSQPELEPLIGFFLNSVVLRTDFSNNPTCIDALKRVKQTAIDGFANGDVPVDLVIEALAIERSAAYTPLAQVAFQLMAGDSPVGATPEAGTKMGDIEFEPIAVESSTAKFDMTLTLNQSKELLIGSLEFNTDLYKPATIKRIIDQYIHISEALISEPEMPVDKVVFCDQAELLEEFSLDLSAYESVWPLTAMQQDMFLDSLINAETLQSSHGFHLVLEKPIDLALWQRCLQDFSDSNSVLRAKFVTAKAPYLDIGYLAIRKPFGITMDVVDLSTHKLALESGRALVNEFIHKPFDVINDELVSYLAIKLPNENYIVAVSAHHALMDGTAFNAMWSLLAEHYAALSNGSEHRFQDTFEGFIDQDRSSIDTEEVLGFWANKLANVEPLDFTLPVQKDRQKSFLIKETYLDDLHWQEVKQYCKKQRITPALYFKAIFAILINTYCRPDKDFTVQETFAGRPKGHYTSPGCYILTIPFVFEKTELSPSNTFESILAYCRQHQKEVKNFRRLSISKQFELTPRGRIGFMYNYFQYMKPIEFLGDYPELVGAHSDPDTNVQFVVSEVSNRLKFNILYHEHVFSDLDFVNRVISFSKQVIDREIHSLSDFELVPCAIERDLLLKQWNNTRQSFDLTLCIHQKFEKQVSLTPHASAIRDDFVTYSYNELNARANRLARHLVSLGAVRGDLVGLCAERSADFLVGILGIMKAGGAYVPMDPKYPQERIEYMLSNSEVKVLLSQEKLLEKVVGKSSAQVVCLDSDWGRIALNDGDNLTLECSPRDRAYMIYTSGSTGQPKGAIVRHDGALNHIEAERQVLEFDSHFSFLQTAPSSSDISVWQFLGPVTCGGQVVVLDDVTHAEKLFTLVKAHNIDVVELVPVALQLLMEYVRNLEVSERSLPSLKWMMATGEAVSIDLVNNWLWLYPNIPVVNAYGPTEAADDVIQCSISDPLDVKRRSVPIGKPLANLQVYVLDEQSRLLPVGVPGEICIGGIGVGEGYWKNPEKTQVVFVENPFDSSLGKFMYRTGDLGRWLPDGNVEYLDRVDNQVKIRGFRIELGEVEAAVSSLEAVRETVVVVRDDMPGGPAIVAYFVSANDATDDVLSLRNQLRSKVPEFMVPTSLVKLEKLPLTPAGKVDRKSLPKPHLMVSSDKVYVAPRNEIESKLVVIWQALLPVEEISVTDSFFDLGGHSLIGVRIMSQVRQVFNVDFQVAELLNSETIEKLAIKLQNKSDAAQSWTPLVTLYEQPDLPIIFAVHPVGGDVLCYADLTRELKSSFSVYGLRSKGFGANQRVYSTFDEMVEDYTQAIIEKQPQGPYRLMAQSLGGVIALAIAGKLAGKGESIEWVAMFDTFTPEIMASKTKSEIDIVEAALGIPLPKAIADQITQANSLWIDNLYETAKSAGLIPLDIELQQVKAIHKVATANHRLVCSSQIACEELPIIHFSAMEHEGASSREGWENLGCNFKFYESSGDHESMIRAENARLVVKKLIQ